MRHLFFIALLVGATTANATETTHYLDLVNTAKNSITSFAVAPAGSNRFREMQLEKNVLQGGGGAATFAIVSEAGGGDCLRDLRTEFANGRILIQKSFDVCKYRSYHTGQYLRGQAQTIVASVP